MNNYQLSPAGAAFILREGHEGVRLKPYLCSAGVPTIGGGCTTYENGKKVTLLDPAITMERALTLFHNRAKEFELCVNRTVQVKLEQHQFDALVSLAFNCGVGTPNKNGFSRPCEVLRCLNAGDEKGLIEWWQKSFVTANGVISKGLQLRRLDELKLYLNGKYN